MSEKRCKHCGYTYGKHSDLNSFCPIYTENSSQPKGWDFGHCYEPEEQISERKIKKGRYKGQPEGTPDCEIYVSHKKSLRYITPQVWGPIRLAFNEDGFIRAGDALSFIEKGWYTPLYEPELYKPKPYDRVGCWSYDDSQIYIYFWGRVSPSWPNIILITEEMVQSETVPTTPKEVEEMDREGKITWIKKGDN